MTVTELDRLAEPYLFGLDPRQKTRAIGKIAAELDDLRISRGGAAVLDASHQLTFDLGGVR